MLASFLTTIFFSLSVIFAARSARVLGPALANIARIAVASALLAIWAHGFGAGVDGPALPWFFLSGIIGFGLGDIALFAALPRIGPRLAILLTQCLAAPIAAFVEWWWLGTTLKIGDLVCAAVILTGVAFALAPDQGTRAEKQAFRMGVVFGCGSAIGQALGAVISRKANQIAALAGMEIDGGSAAYQRILGGLLVTVIVFFVARRMRLPSEIPECARWRRGWPFALANALAGPTLGVACYQWALRSTPSGIVLPIVATSPLVTMILVRFLDGDRPSRRAVVGGLIAVAGVVALQLID